MTANGRTILGFLLGAAIVFVGHALFRADDIVRARFAESACAPAPACAVARVGCSPRLVAPVRQTPSPRTAHRAAPIPLVIDGHAP